MIAAKKPLFPLGRLVATPGAIRVLEEAGISPVSLVSRHATGDWGECDDHDRKANDEAVVSGDRVFSVYVLPGEEKLWVITEADRTSTTILTPDEY